MGRGREGRGENGDGTGKEGTGREGRKRELSGGGRREEKGKGGEKTGVCFEIKFSGRHVGFDGVLFNL